MYAIQACDIFSGIWLRGEPRALRVQVVGEICVLSISKCQVGNKFVDRIAEEVAMGGTAEEAGGGEGWPQTLVQGGP